MTILIVARHGNTFEPGETPRRVGARTDLKLTAQGRAQARALGFALKKSGLLPDAVFTSRLRRTIETAHDAVAMMELSLIPTSDPIFDEIDYGPDENQTEGLVLARLGETALKDWETRGVMPPGWSPDTAVIRQHWVDFAARITASQQGKRVLVVTSNGIARFALNLTGNAGGVGLKLATGAYGVLEHNPSSGWVLQSWNTRP